MLRFKLLSEFLLACIAGMLCLLSGAQALTFDGIPYMDDRSSPEAVVESYYNAINRRDYPQAYSYFRFPPKDFEAWKDGFATTQFVQLRYGPTRPSPGMSQIYWGLPVAIKTHLSDGSSQVYVGCYVLHMVVPGMITEPPYAPIAIERANLEPTDKPLSEVLPASCGE